MIDGMTYEERAQIAENRLQKLEEQIERLIKYGNYALNSPELIELWIQEAERARELIK